MKDRTSQLDAIKSVRKTWGFKPVTRVVADKTKYSRKPKHRNQQDY